MSDSKEESTVPVSIKCMIVGDSQIGKTGLFRTLTDQPQLTDYTPTVFDVINKEVEVNDGQPNKKVNLTLWDSAGSNVFNEIRPISYAHTDCFIICYGVDDRSSFENIEERWLPEIIRHGDGPGVPVVLVATKCDLSPEVCRENQQKHKDIVVVSEGERLREKIGAHAFFQYSTKSGSGASGSEILQKAINLAYLKKIQEEKPPNPIWKFQSLNVILLGDCRVGKSSLIRACIDKHPTLISESKLQPSDDKFQEYYSDVVKDGCEYFLSIGEVSISPNETSFYKRLTQADAIIFCYAINDPFSFQTIETFWDAQLKDQANSVASILIGTKSDLKETSTSIIPTADGEELMLTMKCAAFMECSANTFENISHILTTIIDLAHETPEPSDA